MSSSSVSISIATNSAIAAAKGFGWINGGYEYPLFWGLIMFAIALRGGGPYSLDRKLGWEL